MVVAVRLPACVVEEAGTGTRTSGVGRPVSRRAGSSVGGTAQPVNQSFVVSKSARFGNGLHPVASDHIGCARTHYPAWRGRGLLCAARFGQARTPWADNAAPRLAESVFRRD